MLHYQIEFDDYRQHLIHVTLRFVANPTQVLSLPTWIPGSYLIREFSKHIESVKAYDEAGRQLKITKFEKNKWRLYNTDHELTSPGRRRTRQPCRCDRRHPVGHLREVPEGTVALAGSLAPQP